MITSIKEPNVAIYEKLGFKLVRTGQVSDEGIEVKVSPVCAMTDDSSIACSESRSVSHEFSKVIDVIKLNDVLLRCISVSGESLYLQHNASLLHQV